MDSYEKITTGISLAGEGMAEIITMWGQEFVKTVQRLAEVCGAMDNDDLVLAKGYASGVISPRAYSVATRDRGRRRKKWLRKCKSVKS